MLNPGAYRPRSEKRVGFPPVVVATQEEIGVGGLYYAPERTEVLVADRPHDLSHGLIVATSDGAVAHEWRHHWQWYMGWEYDGIGWPPGRPYRENIEQYFLSSWSEMDALLFELAVHPEEYSLEWAEWLRIRA